ncbi:MAG: AraC family transcriptional regulator [Candidatus Cohnella colombiensis]|uniref:AraC family transcriptional regulator n=1 Tax=Candidatus Cohnella colombiensis TaxID=3121368 RepID=A0AA95F0S3_9BACL|nr:MAG: AraC family transcriptional regulator [Cohnella sp.]
MKYLNSNVTTPLTFISCGQFSTNEPWKHSKRIINSFEIIIGIKEVLYIQQNDTKYEVGPGDVLVLLPDQVHQGYAESHKDISFYWMHFDTPEGYQLLDKPFVMNQLQQLHTQSTNNKDSSSIYIPIYSHPPAIERIYIQFQQILHIAYSNYYTNIGVSFLLTSLLIEMTEQTIQQSLHPGLRMETDKNLAKIMEWVRIHSSSSTLNVSTIAEQFNYNRDYLSRLFKQKTNMNLQSFIHEVKIAKAKDLLSRTSKSTKEIAYSIGINDEKYFMRLFKKYGKITPTEYREAYYRTHMNNL